MMMESRLSRALPAVLALVALGMAASAAALERRPAHLTTPPRAADPAPAVAPADSADPVLEAAVDRLRRAVPASPPSPALGPGFEGLDMPLLARTGEGYLRALSAPAGAAFPLPRGTTGDPAAAAAGFLARQAVAFGVGKPGVRFVAERATAEGGRHFVRLRQEFQAIPVFAAQALVQVGAGGVEFVLADLARDKADLHAPDFDITPSTSKSTAESAALALVGEARPAPDLVVDDPELMIFEPSVIGEAGPSQLVWRTRVRSETAMVDELVLVDAHGGDVAFHFNQIKEAKNRQIYDAANVAGSLGSLARSEGGPATGISDVDLAYTYLGDTYDFFYTRFGRDSLNGAGMTLVARVRYCPSASSCPYQNAYWNGAEMRFGQGFAAADDVVGHELAHGVTENESNLIYWSEAGALNESMSDVFGELIDQTNSGGTDSAAVKWKLGEDVPGIGAIRDMKDPTVFGDPDRRNSPNWWMNISDNRGVHINSGVSNKLSYLLTDGATFNGYTVAALGITKTAALYYEANRNLLVPASDYIDFYYVLRQAAINLGWSPDNRTALERASRAVEIWVPHSITTIVTDDFEANLNKWAVYDYSSPATGTTWGRSTYRKSGGSYSVWCAGGGSSPSPAGGSYKNNMYGWMQYGPFSLAGASRAWFEYDVRLYSEPGYDQLGVFVSTDGTHWYGYFLDNSTVGYTSSGFVRELNDMRDIERVFSGSGVSILGKPQVWLAFAFISDSSVVYEGNYIDNFALYKAGGAPPFGSFDTPANGATGITGAIPVTGWALDDSETTKVEIYRNPVVGEAPYPNGIVYIGDATFVPGARTDVDSTYSAYPYSWRAGWGYMLLTNFFPPSNGNGSYTLYAYAYDGGATPTYLGSKAITLDNAHATKPFGTLDTPGQGQTVSGTINVFGWALTPLPGTIPIDGSTIWLGIDSTYVGHPLYNQYRSDIAGAFPGYNNSNGAVGVSTIDTRTLSNGMHTIGWLVTDDLGRAEGLGSRFFWVQN